MTTEVRKLRGGSKVYMGSKCLIYPNLTLMGNYTFDQVFKSLRV